MTIPDYRHQGILNDNEEPDETVQRAFDIGYELSVATARRISHRLSALRLVHQHCQKTPDLVGTTEQVQKLLNEWSKAFQAVKQIPRQSELQRLDAQVIGDQSSVAKWYESKVGEIFDEAELLARTQSVLSTVNFTLS